MRNMTLMGLLLIFTAGGSCNFNLTPDDGGGHVDDHVHVNLKFAAKVADLEARCGELYHGLGLSGASARIADLRLYVSNVRLLTADGLEVPLELEQDGRWQYQDCALLDFEESCGDTGTRSVNTKVVGTASNEHTYVGVSFDVGVPFGLNHGDLSANPPPLNVSAMYWAWSIGHKFVRVDLQLESGEVWAVHVGSTQCSTSGPASPPAAECAKPNRATIAFRSMDLEHDTIVLDVAELVRDVDITMDTPDSSAGCQSFADDAAECPEVFRKLGLDFSTGRCLGDCGGQTAFRLESGLARGQAAYSALRPAAGGETLSCAGCHGATGAGLIGPDIRSSPASHLVEHSKGDGPHPAGVKFPTLTQAEYEDIAIYLNSLCAADPNCRPFDAESHSHDDDDSDGGDDRGAADDHDDDDHGDDGG